MSRALAPAFWLGNHKTSGRLVELSMFFKVICLIGNSNTANNDSHEIKLDVVLKNNWFDLQRNSNEVEMLSLNHGVRMRCIA